MNAYVMTPDGVSLFIDGRSFNVDRSHQNFREVLDAIREDRFEDIPDLCDIGQALTNYGDGLVEVIDGEVFYNGAVLRNYLVDRMLTMKRDGFNIAPMVAYLTNLMQNPSKRAVDELHKFNEYGKMPITDDGYFIAYKRINGWYDTHSGTVFNKPAHLMDDDDLETLPYATSRGVTVEIIDGVTTISMPRNAVDDVAENTCSQGLHFCSQEYLKSFSGDKIVVLKINPADVVSIPVDYNNTKGRCWKYQVIDVLSQEDFDRAMNTNIFTSPVYTTVSDDFEEDDDWDDTSAEDETIANNQMHFADGYRIGYSDARNGIFQTFAPSTFEQGYQVGHKDGKGHKKKQY